MPRREPRWARKRAQKAERARAAERPEPRFGVTDYVPSPPRPSGAPAAAKESEADRRAGSAAPGATASPVGAVAPVGGGAVAATSGGRPGRRWRLPLAMLVAGLLLGAGGVSALVLTGVVGTTAAAPDPEPAPSRVTVSVPESCTEAGRLAEEVVGITQEIVAATGELDAARLQVLVDRLQQMDPEVRRATAACEQDSPTLSATNG